MALQLCLLGIQFCPFAGVVIVAEQTYWSACAAVQVLNIHNYASVFVLLDRRGHALPLKYWMKPEIYRCVAPPLR